VKRLSAAVLEYGRSSYATGATDVMHLESVEAQAAIHKLKPTLLPYVQERFGLSVDRAESKLFTFISDEFVNICKLNAVSVRDGVKARAFYDENSAGKLTSSNKRLLLQCLPYVLTKLEGKVVDSRGEKEDHVIFMKHLSHLKLVCDIVSQHQFTLKNMLLLEKLVAYLLDSYSQMEKKSKTHITHDSRLNNHSFLHLTQLIMQVGIPRDSWVYSFENMHKMLKGCLNHTNQKQVAYTGYTRAQSSIIIGNLRMLDTNNEVFPQSNRRSSRRLGGDGTSLFKWISDATNLYKFREDVSYSFYPDHLNERIATPDYESYRTSDCGGITMCCLGFQCISPGTYVLLQIQGKLQVAIIDSFLVTTDPASYLGLPPPPMYRACDPDVNLDDWSEEDGGIESASSHAYVACTFPEKCFDTETFYGCLEWRTFTTEVDRTVVFVCNAHCLHSKLKVMQLVDTYVVIHAQEFDHVSRREIKLM
jgi:hypothetical protein